MTKFNHDPEGSASVQDNDLLTIYVTCSSSLPWIICLLEELQFLRDEYRREPSTEELIEGGDYIAYLKSVLDKVEAKYAAESN